MGGPVASDASASCVSPGDKAKFTLGGTNSIDERYITMGHPQFASGVVFGTYIAAPHEWDATSRVRL